MTRQQIAYYAGVSVKTLNNWCKPYREELRAMGMTRSMVVLSPRIVEWLAEKFCIDIDWFFHEMFWRIENIVYLCSDEERIRQMAIGYSQIYGDCIVVVNNLCRHARAYNILYSRPVLLCVTHNRIGRDSSQWTWRQEQTKERKEMSTMNPLIIYTMVAAIIAAGFLFIKYTEWKDNHFASE